MATAKKSKSAASKGTGKATKAAKVKKKLGTDAPPVKGRA